MLLKKGNEEIRGRHRDVPFPAAPHHEGLSAVFDCHVFAYRSEEIVMVPMMSPVPRQARAAAIILGEV
jgi:hypothetical protein